MMMLSQRWFQGGYIQHKGWINTLNQRWTPRILIFFAILAFASRFIENPVDCWCPNEFAPSMVTYANRHCWKTDLIYDMIETTIPKHREARISPENVSWNRWIPIIFLIQAILFKIPGILMSASESKLGFKRNKLRGLSHGYSSLSLEERYNVGTQLARYLNQWLKARILTGLPVGLLTLSIALVYLAYIVNITAQLVILDKYLKNPNVMSYGTHLSNNLFGNRSLPRIESPVFKRIFLCDLAVRKLVNIQHYTVQCVNNINLIYEQLMAFLWVWLLLTAIITYCSCALRAVEIVLPFIRTRYIAQYLKSENVVIHNESDVSRFANSVLGEDGVLVLKGIGEVSSEFLVRDAVINMWYLNFGHRGSGVPHQRIPASQSGAGLQGPVGVPTTDLTTGDGPQKKTQEESVVMTQLATKA